MFINLVAPFFISHEVGTPDTIILVKTTDEEGNPITIIEKSPAPLGYTIQKHTGSLQGDTLTVVKVLSVVGVILISGIGYFASKWAARKSLQPVTRISQTAQLISAHTLDQRLNYQGAQDEVKTLADSFDVMLKRLENNFEDQDEFISNLAHELRTPLTSLRMNLEVLNTNPNASLREYKVFSETAERALNRIERLVEDLLLLAKGEKESDHKLIVLGVLFEEIIEELNPIAEDHHVRLKMNGDLELEVRGDPVLLNRAIANLIENGINYNHPGGFVEISSRKENNQVVIEIRDNGIGISNKQQTHIFERFYRVKENESNNHSGKGLGLDITAHIIGLHHGKISIESALGKGSTFKIYLPKK